MYENLKRLCTRDDRDFYRTPWHVDGYTFATNGNYIVRVSGRFGPSAYEVGAPVLEDDFKFDLVDGSIIGRKIDQTFLGLRFAETPTAYFENYWCDECNGNPACEECCGTQWNFEAPAIRIGRHLYRPDQLTALMDNLGELEFFLNIQIYKNSLAFKFNGGVGCLMQCYNKGEIYETKLSV